MAFNVGYFRTWFGNFLATDNLLVTPADYDPYCITAPRDERLPGGGGNQVCGVGDIKLAQFGLVDNLVTQASHFGKQKEQYDGIDATVSLRFGQGGLLQGGTNFGRRSVSCVVVDAPVQFCENAEPFFRPDFKFSGIYPLPFWGLQASATFQHLPGIYIGSNATSQGSPLDYVATSADVRPSLGRSLATGAGGVATVVLVEPNTMFGDPVNQVDARLTKSLRVGQSRMQGMFEIYNLMNADSILAVIPRYGASFLRPTATHGARMVKFGVQFDY